MNILLESLLAWPLMNTIALEMTFGYLGSGIDGLWTLATKFHSAIWGQKQEIWDQKEKCVWWQIVSSERLRVLGIWKVFLELPISQVDALMSTIKVALHGRW